MKTLKSYIILLTIAALAAGPILQISQAGIKQTSCACCCCEKTAVDCCHAESTDVSSPEDREQPGHACHCKLGTIPDPVDLAGITIERRTDSQNQLAIRSRNVSQHIPVMIFGPVATHRSSIPGKSPPVYLLSCSFLI